MQKEIWKNIPSYEDYQVSNFGNVKSLKFNKEKILKARKGNVGYLYVNLCKNGKCKSLRVHQLVAMSFLKHNPNKTYKVIVDHVDNNPLNNRVDNLQLTTQRHNSSKDKKLTSSKYTGVSWNKAVSKWEVRIWVNGESKYLGRFVNELEASEIYQKELKQII